DAGVLTAPPTPWIATHEAATTAPTTTIHTTFAHAPALAIAIAPFAQTPGVVPFHAALRTYERTTVQRMGRGSRRRRVKPPERSWGEMVQRPAHRGAAGSLRRCS